MTDLQKLVHEQVQEGIAQLHDDLIDDKDDYYASGFIKLKIISAKYLFESNKWFGECNSSVYFDY